jgi:chitinase
MLTNCSINAVYYPNWRIYKGQTPSTLPLSLVSHVFYAFAWVKPSGEVYLSDEWADTQLEVNETNGCLRSFQQLKVEHDHLKVILSVGGGGKGSENFAAVSATVEGRERFAMSAKTLIDEFELDGIDSCVPLTSVSGLWY